jgi:hypothetical protein
VIPAQLAKICKRRLQDNSLLATSALTRLTPWPSAKSAFIESGRSKTHPSLNERSTMLDDNRDLAVVAVTEPVEGHR